MLKLTIFIFYYLFSLIFCIKYSEKKRAKFKCKFGKNKISPKPATLVLPNKKKDNMKIFATSNTEKFKDFNIFLDLVNFDEQIQSYHKTKYRQLFLNGMERAVKTLQSLLKVKPVSKNYQFDDEKLTHFGIKKWNKTKIGNEAIKKNIGMQTLGIDLYIFVCLKPSYLMDDSIAIAGPLYYDEENKRPLLGFLFINKDEDYSLKNSDHYFEGTIIHEFTHVLGFMEENFNNLNMIFSNTDIYGIERSYINSPKVLQVARKYFNCDSIDGVPLENNDGEGTAGCHWEERVLLGEYMIGESYPEETVISEFTLAALEDMGYYQANYYTGGLMKFGKNKGCEFVNLKCVNDGKVNPKFKNEFFDNKYITNYNGNPSCTSGRLSRVYQYLEVSFDPIPEEYKYFDNYVYGVRENAEYCPVFSENMDKEELYKDIYYLGHCSYGSGEYGTFLNQTNGKVQSKTNEKYSNNSFCVLSSLIHLNKKKNEDNENLSVRAICYEMHCSDKSLTIQINNEFIVCPRAGGKIQAVNFSGYILCPDYYLICSGTVLCNDLFDCVEKKSLLKDITYDYEIKTSQDLIESEKEPFSEDNYELSTNGKCPKNCKQCNQLGQCISCRNHYKIIEININNKANSLCVKEDEINTLKARKDFYEKENICNIDNCEYCTDDENCYICHSGYKLSIANKCEKIICLDNCNECENEKKCISCNEGYQLSDNGEFCQKTKINIIFIIIPSIAIILIILIFIIVIINKFLSKGKNLKDDINKIPFKSYIDQDEDDILN